VLALSVGFAGSMLVFELLTEGLWASFRNLQDFPESTGFYLAMFQCFFLAMGALGVKVKTIRHAYPRHADLCVCLKL
jgi:hypothetical protein